MRAAILIRTIDHAHLQAVLTWCTLRGHHPVGITADLTAARSMLDAGEADIIIAATPNDLPWPIEIATVDLATTPPDARRPHRLPRTSAATPPQRGAGPG